MNEPEDIMQDWLKPEELHSELKPYLCEKNGFNCLKHPLVFDIFYNARMNRRYNLMFLKKKECLEKAADEKAWGSYVFFHERPHRFEALNAIADRMPDKEYWSLLGDIWTDSENIWQQEEMGYIPDMLNYYDTDSRIHMMDESEQKFLKKLPSNFTIFRGHQEENQYGYSWSLSHWHAYWFSRRFSGQPHVSEAICRKKDVIAVFMGRSEWEIVVEPENLNIKEIQYFLRAEWMNEIYREAKTKYTLSGRSYHGWQHWLKVERNAVKLASEIGADIFVCQLFGIIHDSKRQNEDVDPEHGLRASQWAKELFAEGKLQITTEQLEKLCFACAHHTEGTTSDDPTIGCCWDADRLDLVRVGVLPEKKYFSTKVASKLMWKI